MVSCGSISVSWDPVPNSTVPVIEYQIRLLDFNGRQLKVISVLPPKPKTEFKNLKSGETYYIRVAAKNNLGFGPSTATIVATPFCKYIFQNMVFLRVSYWMSVVCL